MSRAGKNDRVIVNGRDARVTDAAEFDNLVRVEYGDNSTEYVTQSQIEHNYSEVEFAKQDSDLHFPWQFEQITL